MSNTENYWNQHLEISSESDVGMRRATNQDNFAISLANDFDVWQRRGHLFLVADGMGAHAAGELASKIAVDTIPHIYRKLGDNTSAPEALKKSVIEANAEIHRRGQANEDFYNMGTTCSCLLMLPQGVVVAHIGDSRIYRMRKGRLEQLTFDHSLSWEMRASGQLGEDAANVVPKNVITRSLGPYPDVKVDMEGPFPIEINDVYLICSDGLSGQITDDEIGPILESLSPDEAARVLVDLSNLRGGPDNITLVIAKVTSQKLASGTSVANPIKINANPQGGKIHPLFWAVLAASLIGTIICLFASPYTAIVFGLVTLFCCAYLIYQLSGLASGGTVVTGEKRFGKGPYVRVECASNKEFGENLESVLNQLRDESVKHELLSADDTQIDEFIEAAHQAYEADDFGRAIQCYGRGISYLMQRLRNQSSQQSSDSRIDL